jgi:hypothetical protein
LQRRVCIKQGLAQQHQLKRLNSRRQLSIRNNQDHLLSCVNSNLVNSNLIRRLIK